MNLICDLNKIYSRGITGNGITTAVFDTGIYPHRAFSGPENKIKVFKDFVNGEEEPYDDNGHGTHVGGLIAGYDKGFSKMKNMGIYRGRCPGMAPESDLVVFKVLDSRGNGKMKTMIRAIDWLIKHYMYYGVRIVNISVGMPLDEKGDPQQEILLKKVEQLWDLGLLVIVAAGNEGPGPYTVTVPGISRKVVTVGAYEPERTGKKPGKKHYSGCGPVPGTCVCKPDVIAPASGILSCNNSRDGYVKRSGTSMAAPIVSGVAALLLSEYPRLTNLDIKIRLMETSRDLGLPRNQQGWGLIDPPALLLSGADQGNSKVPHRSRRQTGNHY